MKKNNISFIAIMGVLGIVFAVITVAVKSISATCIWGILAIGMIGLTVYFIIDSIIKYKKTQKKIADIFIKALKEQTSNSDFTENFTKYTDESFSRKEILFESQRPDEDDYGYSYSNPIMTLNIFKTDDYLKKLRTLDGKSFTWERNGSYCIKEIGGIQNVMIDEYQLFLKGKEYKIIYICPYAFQSSYAPKGMQLTD